MFYRGFSSFQLRLQIREIDYDCGPLIISTTNISKRSTDQLGQINLHFEVFVAANGSQHTLQKYQFNSNNIRFFGLIYNIVE